MISSTGFVHAGNVNVVETPGAVATGEGEVFWMLGNTNVADAVTHSVAERQDGFFVTERVLGMSGYAEFGPMAESDVEPLITRRNAWFEAREHRTTVTEWLSAIFSTENGVKTSGVSGRGRSGLG